MNQLKITSKLPDVGTTIFTVMSGMAAEYGAINLSQGFPDFECPDELKDLVNHYIQSGKNQYAPMAGVPLLRERISAKIDRYYGHSYNPETEITITAGATQALFTAVTALVNAGDEVIIFEPAFDSYAPSVIVNGGVPVFVPLNEKDFSIDWDKCKNAVTSKTRLIIINSPHNPTGSIISLGDLKQLEEITKDTGIFILSDEVYEHVIFDGLRHISLCRSGELSKRSFIVSSFGKTYHTTGWKMGYCAAPENLMIEFRKVHQFNVFAVNTPVQHAYADFILNENHFLRLSGFYEQKRNLLAGALADSKFKLQKTSGTYFQLLDYSEVSDKNNYEFVEYLTKEAGVAAIPFSAFYYKENKRKIIRLCFAKKDEVLLEAAGKLCNI